MNINASIPAWVVLLMVIVLTALVLYMAFVAHRNGTATDLTIERMAFQRDRLNTENDRLNKDLQGTRATIKVRDIDIGRLVGEKEALRLECEKWQGLYNELLTTYHAAQGDAHATVPLQEAAPVKRTRKKAETKQ